MLHILINRGAINYRSYLMYENISVRQNPRSRLAGSKDMVIIIGERVSKEKDS